MRRIAWILAVLPLIASSISAQGAELSGSCQPTLATVGVFENKFLAVTISDRFVFRPDGPGFVDADGALGIKVAWERKTPGLLQVGGRRLDGKAPPARAYIYDYGTEGFQPSYLVFPTPGCWEITGNVAGESLTFVVGVEKVGEGPTRKFQGLEPGWRVTSVSVGAN